MKKVIFIAFVAVAALTSCKKDRTCTCTTVAGSYTDTQVTTYTAAKKADARAACMSTSYIPTGSTVTVTTTCTLK
jgi:hypothetical protein